MTGYTVNTGSSEKFATGWDNIFKKKSGQAKRKTRAKAAKKAVSKQGRKKS